MLRPDLQKIMEAEQPKVSVEPAAPQLGLLWRILCLLAVLYALVFIAREIFNPQ